MSSMTIGFLILGLMLALLFLGTPIPFAFGISGFIGIVAILGWQMGLEYMSTVPVTTAASYTYTVMPMFLLMGEFAFSGGLTTDAYGSARKWFSGVPGGLAVTSTAASAIFGAVCGSGATTAMVMTQIAWPEMKRYGYSPRLGLGSIAAAGPLAILIPPSVPLMMYGILSEASVGQLFMAGWIPGILLMLTLSLTTIFLVKRDPASAPGTERYSLREKLVSLKNVWAILLLIVIIMGGIWGGLCTVNEAAGIGVIGALIIGMLRRKLKPKEAIAALKGVAGGSVSMYFSFVGLQIFNIFMALSGLPRALAGWIAGLSVPPIVIIWGIIVLYLFLGCFLDAPPIMLLTVSLIAPAVSALGYSLVWFGIVVAFTVAIAALTPPVGINLFVIRNRVPDVNFSEVLVGVMPYLAVTFITLVIIVFIPQISLFLPNLMFG